MFNDFYMRRLPGGAVVYGRLYRVCLIQMDKYLGIKTPDCNEDCIAAALEEIRKLDDSPRVSINFNDTPPEQAYGHF